MKRRYVVLALASVLALSLAVPAFGGPTNFVSALTKIKKTANKALKKAKAASAAAAAAQVTANGAQSAADAAGKAAKAALNTADEGVTGAKAAQTTANSALGIAKSAQAAADAAQATANSKFGQTFTVAGNTSPATKTSQLSLPECPAGSQLTGGGYRLQGAGSNEAVPFWNGPYGNAWLADLEGIGGESTNSWSVVGLAQCARP